MVPGLEIIVATIDAHGYLFIHGVWPLRRLDRALLDMITLRRLAKAATGAKGTELHPGIKEWRRCPHPRERFAPPSSGHSVSPGCRHRAAGGAAVVLSLSAVTWICSQPSSDGPSTKPVTRKTSAPEIGVRLRRFESRL
jgi:hypothetical protein